jgi:nicotinate-nucleotide adenylyltransferase
MAPFADRLDQEDRLLRAATHHRQRSSPGWWASHTADTQQILRRRFPRTRFAWLMGADNLVQLRYWQRWDRTSDGRDCRLRPAFIL